MPENKKEKYVPVKVINKIKSVPDKQQQVLLMICAICLFLSFFFNAMLFYTVDDIEMQLETLNEKNVAEAPTKSVSSIIFAANNLSLKYSFNSLDPIEFTSEEGDNQQNTDLSFINISAETYTNVNASINVKSLQALTEELNSKDSAFQYELNVDNENCTLKITRKDENAGSETAEYTGSLSSSVSYVLGNGESALNMNLSAPITTILNRIAFLQLKPAAKLEINVVGTDLSNQNKMSVFTLDQNDVHVDLGDDFTPGTVSYTLACKNEK